MQCLGFLVLGVPLLRILVGLQGNSVTEKVPCTKTAKALSFRHFPASVVVRNRGSNTSDKQMHFVMMMFGIIAAALNSVIVLLMLRQLIRTEPPNRLQSCR